MLKHYLEEREKEFNKHFPEYFEGAYYEKEDTNLGDELKSFHRQTCIGLLEEIMDAVKAEYRKVEYGTDELESQYEDRGYNSALDFVKHSLQAEIKELEDKK